MQIQVAPTSGVWPRGLAPGTPPSHVLALHFLLDTSIFCELARIRCLLHYKTHCKSSVLYNLVLGLGGWLLAHNHILPSNHHHTAHTAPKPLHSLVLGLTLAIIATHPPPPYPLFVKRKNYEKCTRCKLFCKKSEQSLLNRSHSWLTCKFNSSCSTKCCAHPCASNFWCMA